ncbi:MAG: 2-oxo acid dehydrogenase subunit E2 [Acidobacteriota bacterium]|nr:2-oxo acid dehydrogenase subunit E2 [Acidobacteriota bacterium]
MPLKKRCDGVYLRKLPGFRKAFPFLMPTRTESVIYYPQRVRLRETMAWLEKFNAGRERKISIFYVVLAAGVRTLAMRPDANRFVSGRRIYQRRSIDLSFIVKRELTDEATETNAKLSFDPRSTIEDVAGRVSAAIKTVKKSDTTDDEKLTDLLTRIPRHMTRFVVWIMRTLDYFGSLPASFVRGDAFFSSAYLANLGGIGLEPVFHHMFEFGNTPFFIVIGKPKKVPIVNEAGGIEAQEVMDMNISLDERITDGVNYAKTIGLLTDLIEHPAKLETPPDNVPDPYEFA